MWVEEGGWTEEYDTAKVDYISSFGFPNVLQKARGLSIIEDKWVYSP